MERRAQEKLSILRLPWRRKTIFAILHLTHPMNAIRSTRPTMKLSIRRNGKGVEALVAKRLFAHAHTDSFNEWDVNRNASTIVHIRWHCTIFFRPSDCAYQTVYPLCANICAERAFRSVPCWRMSCKDNGSIHLWFEQSVFQHWSNLFVGLFTALSLLRWKT